MSIFLGTVILMGMINPIYIGIVIPLKNEWNSYFLWNEINFPKNFLFYFVFILRKISSFCFPAFPHPPNNGYFLIFNLVFVLSLSLTHTHTTGLPSGEDLRRRPSGPSRLDHHAETLPPGLRQSRPMYPHRTQPNPPERRGRLLCHREASVRDPRCSHGRQHSNSRSTGNGRTTPKSCRGWLASQWGCWPPH
jgi:hypothetical protein